MAMRNILLFLIICLISVNSGFAQHSNTISSELQDILNQKNNELIDINIIFKSQMTANQLSSLNYRCDSREMRREMVINDLKKFSEDSQKDVLSIIQAETRSNNVTDVKTHWIANFINCKASRDVIYQLASHPDIEMITYNHEMEVVTDMVDATATRAANTTIGQHLTQINADKVWDLGYTGKGVIVAVLDSGVNTEHTDLKDHLWNGNAQHGYNAANPGSAPTDDASGSGHGTHCAGIVCGDGTSGTATGVAPDATLMCIKLYNAGSGMTLQSLTNGIEFATDNGADILSISQGWKNPSGNRTTIRTTFENLLQMGVVAAVAAGNDRADLATLPVPNNVRTPGDCPPPWLNPDQTIQGGLSSVISVGGVNEDNTIGGISSQGPVTWEGTSFNDYPYNNGASMGLIRPDICAPISVKSLANATTGYVIKGGTSQAAPAVAGVMALMLEKNPDLTPADLCRIIETTATKLSQTKSNDFGSGLINALAAVQAVNFNETVKLNPYSYTKNFNASSATQNLELTLINNGTSTTNGTTNVTLTTSDANITIDNGSASLGAMASNGTATCNFTLSVSTFTPDNHKATLTVTTSGAYSTTFDIEINISNELVAPSNITAQVENLTNINLSWTATNNATSYNIYRDGAYLANTTSTSYLDANLEYGTLYSYTITTKRNELESEHSKVIRVQTEDNPDSPSPTNVVATVNGNNMDVTWTNATGSKSSNVYRKDANGTETSLVSDINGSSYTDNTWSSLPNGTYQYGVSNNHANNETIYEEGFESSTLSTVESTSGWFTYATWSTNWSIKTSSTLGNEEFTPYLGEKAAFVANTANNTSYLSYLVTPQFNLTEHNGSKITFSFYYITPSWAGDINTLNVKISTNSNKGEWTQLWTSNKQDVLDWTKVELDLSAYANNTFYIAFENVIGAGYCTGVDEVSFDIEGSKESRIEWSDAIYKGVNMFVNDGLWSDTDNWSAKRLPTENDEEVYIDANATITTGDIVVNSLIINESGSLTLNDGATLTVNNDFKNTDPNAFIINDGAQVFQSNDDVAATFKMNMYNPQSWGADGTDHDGGWQFIASPLKNASINDFIPLGSDYDLYKYVGTNVLEWVNQKNEESYENEIIIGDGNDGTEGNVPTNTNYNYTISQQIYTAEELGGEAGLITSYSFKKSDDIFYYGNAVDVTRTFDVYVLNTDKESFSSETDYVDVTTGTHVFSGSVHFAAKDEWTTIVFDTPFLYEKGRNIIISINDVTGSFTSAAVPFYQFTTDEYRSIVKYNDNNEYNSLNPADVTEKDMLRNQYVALAKFNITPTVPVPDDPADTLLNLATTFYYPFHEGDFEELNPYKGNLATYNSPGWQITPETGYYANIGKDGSKAIYSMSYNAETQQNFTAENYIVTKDAYLITENSKLSWWATHTDPASAFIDTYKAVASRDGINFDIVLWDGPWSINDGNPYEEIEISLAAYAGEGLYIGFCHYTDGTQWGGAIVLDEIWLTDGTGGGEDQKPAAPSNLTAIATSSSTIELTWNIAKGADTYNIYQDGTQIANGISGTNHVATNLTAATQHCFTVTAVNANGESGQSSEACATTFESYEIGSDENLSTSYYLPAYDYSAYSFTQQIYTADDFDGDKGTIYGVSFKLANQRPATTRNYEVYLRHTPQNQNSFNGTNYIAVSEQYKVFDGEVEISGVQDSWFTVTFDTPFTYIGGSILLCVYDKTGTGLGNSGYHIFHTYSATNRALRSNGTSYDANSFPTTATATVQAVNLVQFSIDFVVPVIPAAPQNLVATASSESAIDLSWNAVDGAKSYNIYQDNTQIATEIKATSYTVEGLTEATQYCYTVTAVNRAGESDKSNEACATTKDGPLSEFYYPFDDAEEDFSHWNTYDKVDMASSLWKISPSTGYYANIGKDGSACIYSVSYNEETYSSYNYVENYVVTNDKYLITEDSKLSWWVSNTNPSNGAHKDLYKVLISEDGEDFDIIWDGIYDKENHDMKLDLSAYAGKEVYIGFCHYIVGYGSTGSAIILDELKLSATDDGNPVIPYNLTATATSDATIELTWDAVDGATSYNVYQIGEYDSFTQVATGIATNSYEVTGLTAETEYCFAVASTNANGTSGKSEEACATTEKGEAEGLCDVIFELFDDYDDGWKNSWGNNYLTVSYDDVSITITCENVKSYTETLQIPQGSNVTITYTAGGGSWPYAGENSFVVKYDNDEVILEKDYAGTAGNSSFSETFGPFEINCAPKEPEAPAAPVLTATATGSSTISLTWEAVDGATSYNVYQDGVSIAIGLTTTSYNVEGLTAGNEYCFTVTAVNNVDESEDSAEACATPEELAATCDVVFTLYDDQYKYGWFSGYNYLNVSYNETTEMIKPDQSTYTKTLQIPKGAKVSVQLVVGYSYYISRASFDIKYADGNVIYSAAAGSLPTATSNMCEFDVNCASGLDPDPNPNPDPSSAPTSFFYDFNDGSLDDFNLIDENADGYNWEIENTAGVNGTKAIISYSWRGSPSIKASNNLIVTKQMYKITESSTLSFDVHCYSGFVDRVSIEVSADGNTFVPIESVNPPASNFTTHVCNLGEKLTTAGLSYGNYYIALRHKESDLMHVIVDNYTLTDGSAKSRNAKSQDNTSSVSVSESESKSKVQNPSSRLDMEPKFRKKASTGTELSESKTATRGRFETEFEQGRGYMASYEKETVATFKGILNHERSFTYTASYHDKFTANFFLYGNPFSFDMDWNNVSVSNMIDGYAMVNPDGSYSYYVDGKIKVGDGFFARSTADAPTISYSETRNKKDINSINVIAKGNNGKDNVIINLNDQNDGFPKIENFNKKISNIYVSHNDIDYGIYNYSSDVEEVELNFDAKQIGKYTINIEAKGEFDIITLVDRFTGSETDMLLNDYSFTASVNDESGRFLLRLSAKNNIGSEEDGNFVYQSGDELIIKAEGDLQIVDIMGRIVYNGNVNNGNRINISHLNTSTYIVRCIDNDKVRIQKIVIL